MRLFYALAANLIDEGKAHLSHSGTAVQAAFLFHLKNNVFNHFNFILVRIQFVKNNLVAFKNLGCCKANRNAGSLSMVVNKVNNSVNSPVNGTTVVVYITQVLVQRFFLVAGYVNSVVNQFVNTLVFSGGNWNNRNPQHLFNFININRAAVSCNFVHHVQSHNHRHVQFQKLHSQVKVSFNGSSIKNIYNSLRLFFQNKVAGNNLFAGKWRHRVNTRQVGNQSFRMAFNNAVLSVNCNAREVSNVLVRTCKLIKKGSLTTVLVSHQGVSKLCVCRQRIFCCLIRICFTKARVFRVASFTFFYHIG